MKSWHSKPGCTLLHSSGGGSKGNSPPFRAHDRSGHRGSVTRSAHRSGPGAPVAEPEQLRLHGVRVIAIHPVDPPTELAEVRLAVADAVEVSEIPQPFLAQGTPQRGQVVRHLPRRQVLVRGTRRLAAARIVGPVRLLLRGPGTPDEPVDRECGSERISVPLPGATQPRRVEHHHVEVPDQFPQRGRHNAPSIAFVLLPRARFTITEPRFSSVARSRAKLTLVTAPHGVCQSADRVSVAHWTSAAQSCHASFAGAPVQSRGEQNQHDRGFHGRRRQGRPTVDASRWHAIFGVPLRIDGRVGFVLVTDIVLAVALAATVLAGDYGTTRCGATQPSQAISKPRRGLTPSPQSSHTARASRPTGWAHR